MLSRPFSNVSGVAQPPFRDRSILRHDRLFVKRCYFRLGSKASFRKSANRFRYTPVSGPSHCPVALRVRATFGHLWEPRTSPKHGCHRWWPRTYCDQPQDQSVTLTCHIQLAGGPIFAL
jgi:hypothetical protein